MPRRERPPGRKRMPGWALALVILGPIVLVSGVIAGGAWVWRHGQQKPGSTPAISADAEPLRDKNGRYAPADLRRYFVGKSEGKAIGFFGTPSRVLPVGQLTIYLFMCPTEGPTGKAETMITVTCDRHVVTDILCGDADKP